MKLNTLSIILFVALAICSLVSCGKSEIVKNEEKRHEAAVAAIRAQRDSELATEKSDNKVALEEIEAAELQVKSMAKLRLLREEQAKKEKEAQQQPKVVVATPKPVVAPAPAIILPTPAITLVTPGAKQ
jgi:hypothetical protein